MNFIDTYEITRPATPNVDQADREQPTLNEEVNQVIGQFWGGFRKQSQQAMETARKDFSDVVVQAQKEFSKLTVNNETPNTSTSEHREGEATPVDTSKQVGSSGSASTSREIPNSTGESNGDPSSQSFFSRLQTSLPPNMVSTIQNHIPESIKHASENVDLGQLRSTLVSDFQRVQGVTRAQAEEYYHKSEALVREAVKEAGEVLKDAVRVIPPEEGHSTNAGMVWDGSDVWMLPHENVPEGGEGQKSSSSSSSRPGEQLTAAAVATRAEALLRRLKHDPSILRHDPEEDVVRADFLSWQEKEVDSREGGIDGAVWSGKIAAAIEDPIDGQGLKELEETLVPAEMTKSVFWLRFFFRSHQIRREEEKRKALIQSTTESEDDFSWEDDEDEGSPGNKSGPGIAPVGTDETKQGIAPTEALLRAEPSRRVNSTDSFDLVSAASASASVSVVGDSEKIPKGKPEEEEDGDSDWE